MKFDRARFHGMTDDALSVADRIVASYLRNVHSDATLYVTDDPGEPTAVIVPMDALMEGVTPDTSSKGFTSVRVKPTKKVVKDWVKRFPTVRLFGTVDGKLNAGDEAERLTYENIDDRRATRPFKKDATSWWTGSDVVWNGVGYSVKRYGATLATAEHLINHPEWGA